MSTPVVGVDVWTHIDLCCGLGGWQAPFREDPRWRSIGIDIRDDLNADIVADVRRLPLRDGIKPELLTASPPCNEFSTAWNRWQSLHDRDPDRSVWEACERAAERLDARFYVIENVAGAQYFFGDSDWSRHPWHLWGRFPPMDTGPLRSKGETWNQRPEETAVIPETLARAVKQSVELYLTP